MIKNFERLSLVIIAILFVGIMIGIFIGIQASRSPITLSPYHQETTAESDNAQDIHIAGGKLNINTATASELSKLPGIGESYAKRIIEYREEHGPFITISDLMNVSGIGEKRLEAISDYITVGG